MFMQYFGLFLWYIFDPFLVITSQNYGFQFFYSSLLNKNLGLCLTFGIDGFSLMFILLTIFVFTLCFFAISNFSKVFKNLLVGLYLLLLLNFMLLDFILFYLAFECSLIPMFFIIGLFGSRARKIKATFYLFIYTTATAFLTLFCLFYIILQVGSTFYLDLLTFNFTITEQKILWFCIFLTFATKIPIIPFHIWLPEAHVEAPTVGSVILASILLKLGGYGFSRFLIPIFSKATLFFLPFVFSLAICSVVYASFTTIRQIDLKRIVAYSSIAHMNLAVLGIFSLNVQGIDGALYLMIGHGVVSSALFFLVGFMYDRFHTKLLRYYGGLIIVMPVFGIFFFLFTMGNVGFPTTSNFIGEFLILIGIFIKNPFIALFAGFGIILSAVYSFWLYTRVFFGTLKTDTWFIFSEMSIKELLIIMPLTFLMFFLGINSTALLNISTITTEIFLINCAFYV
jgi:NADH-quinone oxidoreductase subunit M